MADPSFDYVIVGAGSAGCAVAGRLSEDPAISVLVLEAGGKDRSLNIKIPAAFSKQFKTKLDWDHSTGPEPHLDDRELFVPRGKSLGGSSSMNAMMHVRGRPLDYEGWREAGCEGWGWEDVLPYFRRMENDERHGATEVHGDGGPVNVAQQVSPRPVTKRFLEASQAAGIPFNDDINSPEQDGVGMTSVTQKGGKRWSAADAYLRPAMKRPNVTVQPNAEVLGIGVEDGRAATVRWRDKRGREQVARASGEVILSAGAIGSPQLLMLSGIGPADHLAELGIDTVADSPGVGDNLQDHPFFLTCFRCTENEDLADELAQTREQLVEAEVANAENDELRGLLGINKDELSGFGFTPVAARVVTRTPSLVNATVGVNAGSGDGIEVDDAVIAADGLVGRVSQVTSTSAQVQLITDPRNGVSVTVAEPNGPQGIVSATAGEPDELILEFFSNDDEVSDDQFVVTAGWSDPTTGLSSAYPRGIAVGAVTEASTGDVDFQQVTVDPFVDFQELTYVEVLTGGPERPGVDP